MTNLIGVLLHASQLTLNHLAARWYVEGDAESSLIGSTYRRMTDAWWLRRFLDGLTVEQRTVLRKVVAAGPPGTTISTLTAQLPLQAQSTRAAIMALRKDGLLVDGPREQSVAVCDDVLPLLRKLFAEAVVSDERGRSIRSLLEKTDRLTLAHIADRWGIPHPDRLNRRDMIGRLEQLLTSVPAVERALSEVDEAAVALFEGIRAVGGWLGWEDASALAGEDQQSLKTAYGQLHAWFLAHVATRQGRSGLWIPVEVGTAMEAPDVRRPPALAAVDEPESQLLADDSLLHDLERLLHRVSATPARSFELKADGIRSPKSSDSAVRMRMRFALHCAEALGLIVHEGAGWIRGQAADSWSGLDSERQAAALFELWLSERSSAETPGNVRRARFAMRHHRLRQRLRLLLAHTPSGTWWGIRSLVEQARWARLDAGLSNNRLLAGNPAGLLDAFVIPLQYGLHWLGTVDLGLDAAGNARAFRISFRGRLLLGSNGRTIDRVLTGPTVGC